MLILIGVKILMQDLFFWLKQIVEKKYKQC
jgi:hypothetical protein